MYMYLIDIVHGLGTINLLNPIFQQLIEPFFATSSCSFAEKE